MINLLGIFSSIGDKIKELVDKNHKPKKMVFQFDIE